MIYGVLIGGLGNQLFQIFATIAYALQNGHSFAFQKNEYLGRQDRPTYWRNFLAKLQPYLVEHLPNITYFENGQHEYNALPIVPSSDNGMICIEGYFQSELYFKPHFSTICDMIDLGHFQSDLLANKDYGCYSQMISMHFRLGDYKKLPSYHPILPYEYYKKSLDHILSIDTTITNLLYFCEVEDNDTVLDTIMKLQVEFPGITFNKAVDSASDWQQVLMMSICRHHIIANSSFSWWGAYFHRYINKNGEPHLVCHPKYWFGSSHINMKDVHPKEWTEIIV